MNDVVFLKKEDLIDAIRVVVEETLKREPEQETLNIDEATNYLNSVGYSVKKSTLYKMTSEGKIPFHRFGERKLVFKASELGEWIESKTRKVN